MLKRVQHDSFHMPYASNLKLSDPLASNVVAFIA
jgi:hypothetical protein